jgi:glycerate 2-kinase
MITIRNKDNLIKKAETNLAQKARAIALRSLEYTLNSVDAGTLLKSKVTLKNHQLRVNTYSFNFDRFRNVYVVGGGKAAGSMGEALEEILDERVTEGVLNVPHGDKHKTRIIKLHGASHPIPDEASAAGTRHMMEIVEKANEDDLVIVLISGGAPVSCRCHVTAFFFRTNVN